MIPPLAMRWDGEALRPLHPRRADQNLVIGQAYTLVEHQERSRKNHDHYFAVVHGAWLNLPDDLAARWPSEDHLRRFALIRAGFCTQREIVCASRAEALRWATEMSRASEFAVVEATGPVVTIYEAKSQSMRAMGKAMFDESKAKTLDVLAEIIGTDPTTLRTQAARAA
jgi:hypothetical protein